MGCSRRSPFDYLRLGLIGILVGSAVCIAGHGHRHTEAAQVVAPLQTQGIAPLSADDVSLLFPAPTKTADLAKLIAVHDLTAPDPQNPAKRNLVWSDSAFESLLGIAQGQFGQVAGAPPPNQIGLPQEAQSETNWFIAGIRVDPGAPGLSNEIRAQFGQAPQIRLIVQPVKTNADGTVHVDDLAVHLIFDFTKSPAAPAQQGCNVRFVPDDVAFGSVVADVVALRDKLSAGQLGAKISTVGAPLGVHPGLADPTTASALRQEIQSFLVKHIAAEQLDAMAIAATPAGQPAPWIFLSLVNLPAGFSPAAPNGGFVPVPGPTLDGQQFSELLMPDTVLTPRAFPQPTTNNLNATTCKSAAAPGGNVPAAQRSGVSTASLLVTPVPSAAQAAPVLDVIADPSKSHFFNTDCVSCHTETRLSMHLLQTKSFPGIDPTVLPPGDWDIRNFGWAPAARGVAHAMVTRRTAAETAAALTFINSQVLPKQAALKR
jgi:hypothetical protein